MELMIAMAQLDTTRTVALRVSVGAVGGPSAEIGRSFDAHRRQVADDHVTPCIWRETIQELRVPERLPPFQSRSPRNHGAGLTLQRHIGGVDIQGGIEPVQARFKVKNDFLPWSPRR